MPGSLVDSSRFQASGFGLKAMDQVVVSKPSNLESESCYSALQGGLCSHDNFDGLSKLKAARVPS